MEKDGKMKWNETVKANCARARITVSISFGSPEAEVSRPYLAQPCPIWKGCHGNPCRNASLDSALRAHGDLGSA